MLSYIVTKPDDFSLFMSAKNLTQLEKYLFPYLMKTTSNLMTEPDSTS